jgi:N-acetylglutamate synthase-like GNAT family acetyltransferase
MIIRAYNLSDLEGCRALWAEMTERHRRIYNDPTIGGENPGLEFDARLVRVGLDLVWVAEAHGGIVGLVSLIHEDEQAEIEPIVVRSDTRKTGIGHQLLEHAVTQAKALGVLCLSVKPVARNREAISFFRDAGFRTLGHIQLFMWLGDSSPDQWRKGPELFGKPFDY